MVETNKPKMDLQERIRSGKSLLLAEVSFAAASSAAEVRQLARAMPARSTPWASATIATEWAWPPWPARPWPPARGVEPILHVTTRDRNRVALVSDVLGARALGIANILCTSGTHQTLGRFRTARNVYDVDAVQLLRAYAHLGDDAALVGEETIPAARRLLPGRAWRRPTPIRWSCK